MNPHYNQNYTKLQIEKVLNTIKECILNGNYSVSQNENRAENIQFIQGYNLTAAKQREVLLGIKVEDFCYSLQNTHQGYEHETLYVFIPAVELLDPFGLETVIEVYTKFNIIDTQMKTRTIVISFHKANEPATYTFQ